LTNRKLMITTFIILIIALSYILFSELSINCAWLYSVSQGDFPLATRIWYKLYKFIHLTNIRDIHYIKYLWIAISIITGAIAVLLVRNLKESKIIIASLIITIIILLMVISIFGPLAQFLSTPLKL